MEDHKLDRRQILGGMAAAGAAGALGGLAPQAATAAEAAGFPDVGTAQAPTLATVKDKVAYVTGGSSGIGLGIARVLHDAGAKVVIGYIDDKQIADALKLFPANDPRVHSIKHDVMDREGWVRAADDIEKKFGPLHILVNNAGVGLQQSASRGSLNDWDWGLGVNFMGPIYGVNTFVPRMLAHGQGSQIVTTTSTSGIVPNPGTGIYSVAKMAAVTLMEQLRAELRETTIGTTCFVPGLTTSNIGQSENYRPDALRNEAATQGPGAFGAQSRPAAGGPGAAAARPAPAASSPYWARPQDPVVVGRVLLDGILHNDLYVVLQPEWRLGVEARMTALLESMVPPLPFPETIDTRSERYLRTPIYVQEVAHRRATRRRPIQGI